MNFKSSQLTCNTTVCSNGNSGKYQIKHQCFALLTLCQVIPLWHGGLIRSIRLYGLRCYHWLLYCKSMCRQYCFKLVNRLRPRQNGRHFPNDIFKWILLNENVWILITISLNFVSLGVNQQYSSIGSDKCLAPTRRQVIIWTNDG